MEPENKKAKTTTTVLCSLCRKRNSERESLFFQGGKPSTYHRDEIEVCSLCQTIRWGERRVCIRCRKGRWIRNCNSYGGLWDGDCLPERPCGSESDYDVDGDDIPPPLGLEERWRIERPAVFEMWRRGVQFFRRGQDFVVVKAGMINDCLVGKYDVYWVKYLGEDQEELSVPDQEMERSVFGTLEIWQSGEGLGNEIKNVYDGMLRFPDSDYLDAIGYYCSPGSPNCCLSLRLSGRDNDVFDPCWIVPGESLVDDEERQPLAVSQVAQETFLEWYPCESAPAQGDYCSVLKNSAESLMQRLDQNSPRGNADAAQSFWITTHLGLPEEVARTVLRFIVIHPPQRSLKVDKGDLLLTIDMDYGGMSGLVAHVDFLARKVEATAVPVP